MNIYVQQSIQIRMIKIGGISNSSVFQIGSAGIIKPASYLYNTGGYTQPAPTVGGPQGQTTPPLFTPSISPTPSR
ncbi:spore germination protein GerPB [Heyndrickxia acidicola]|uniref:Spore germination protein GerPB n=1 Tax=Heyndrickxia acidicola TaxID=209389 RepID=A0ABU6MCT5_9BACI|nr:spore germination protein GerPB [Heyndrickxia acidicola]MED1202481.1 spore germination protein GerPB [Heyndrickxia acidicola]